VAVDAGKDADADRLLARGRRPRSNRVRPAGRPEWPDRVDDLRLESPENRPRIRPVARGTRGRVIAVVAWMAHAAIADATVTDRNRTVKRNRIIRLQIVASIAA
jgi:hypothetical protein